VLTAAITGNFASTFFGQTRPNSDVPCSILGINAGLEKQETTSLALRWATSLSHCPPLNRMRLDFAALGRADPKFCAEAWSLSSNHRAIVAAIPRPPFAIRPAGGPHECRVRISHNEAARPARQQFVKHGNVQSMIVPRTGELLAGRPSKIHRRLKKSKGANSWLTSIYRLLRSEKVTVPIKSNANSRWSPHLQGFSKRHAPPAGTHST
jgi:hypothetical protein